MKRIVAFLALMMGALAAVGALLVWYLGTYMPQGWSFGGMMGQMAGGAGQGSVPQGPGWVPLAVLALILVGVAGAGGVVYLVAYPEIRATPSSAKGVGEGGTRPEVGWAVLMRTSKPDEKKVLGSLAAHGGSYLQKFVVKESGLSRLKTHRIVSRLAERGVVTVERRGNTNQVTLAPWVRRDEEAEQAVSAAV